jgi:hypothetical protein
MSNLAVKCKYHKKKLKLTLRTHDFFPPQTPEGARTHKKKRARYRIIPGLLHFQCSNYVGVSSWGLGMKAFEVLLFHPLQSWNYISPGLKKVLLVIYVIIIYN